MLIRPTQLEANQSNLHRLESELRARALIYDPTVQHWLRIAYNSPRERPYRRAIEHLGLAIRLYDEQAMRTDDPFAPYCPPSLIQGMLRLIDQMDGLAIQINPDKLLTGLIIAGPQGLGKSRLIIHVCNELLRLKPNVRITIVDPKAGFANLSAFKHIGLSRVSLTLAPPSTTNERDFIYQLMAILGDTTGLIYGQEILAEAANNALADLETYRKQTGNHTYLCLHDVVESLRTMKVTGPRRPGYRDAALTALLRIMGQSRLWSCRKGLSAEDLFRHNTILNARDLTDDMQCRFLATYLLYWLYQRARFEAETNEIRHIVVIDDASRFVGALYQFEAHTQTSPLGHILAVLRSTGTCLIVATQLPAQVDPAVLSLCRNMIVVGNVNGEDNLRIIKNFMSLTDPHKESIVRFQKREVLIFISDSPWPRPIHGFTCPVDLAQYTTPTPTRDLFEITVWHPLTSIPTQPTVVAASATAAAAHTRNGTAPDAGTDGAIDTRTETVGASVMKPAPNVREATGKLILDCIHYPYDKVRNRIKRLDMSVRAYDAAKNEAVQTGYLIGSSAGKTLYLIPTQKAYDEYGFVWPYKRSTSVEHSFYVNLAAHVLRKVATLAKVEPETPIGSKGATIDITTIAKDGTMTAYEITLSTSNLSSNAAKLQDTSYTKIVWLCRDADTAKAVAAYFNKTTTLPLGLQKKFQCIHLSKWLSHVDRSQEKANG